MIEIDEFNAELLVKAGVTITLQEWGELTEESKLRIVTQRIQLLSDIADQFALVIQDPIGASARLQRKEIDDVMVRAVLEEKMDEWTNSNYTS